MTDSSKESKSIGDCRVCQRSGLPIMPIRYAITRTDGEDVDIYPAGPEVKGEVLDESLSDIPLPKGQRYTLRLLREGFLYVYNELRGEWLGHYVTEQGYLIEFIKIKHSALLALDLSKKQKIDNDLTPKGDKKEFACAASPEHVYPGRCLMIPNADRADNIYIAFSDVAWTKRVWKEFAQNKNSRRDSMRKISLSNWRSGYEKYADSLDNIENYVSEATRAWLPNNSTSKTRVGDDSLLGRPDASIFEGKAFNFSLFKFNGIKNNINGLKKWADKEASIFNMKPMIVCLQDPAGITADLSRLTKIRADEFELQDDIYRPYITYQTLFNLERTIKVGVKENFKKTKIQNAVDDLFKSYHPEALINYEEACKKYKYNFEAFHGPEIEEAVSETQKTFTDERLEKEADDGWSDYSKKLRDGEPRNWLENVYNKKKSEWYQENVLPLADTCKSWLLSTALVSYLDSNFDDENINSGSIFTSLVALMTQGTQEFLPTYHQYVRWLSSESLSSDNLLLRALYLNNKTLQTEAESAIKNSGVQPYVEDKKLGIEATNILVTLPWDRILSCVEKLGEFPSEIFSSAWLFGRFSGPIIAAINAKTAPKLMLVGVGMLEKEPVEIWEIRETSRKLMPKSLTAFFKKFYPGLKGIGSDYIKQFFQKNVRGSFKEMSEELSSGKRNYLVSFRKVNFGRFGSFKEAISEALVPIKDVKNRQYYENPISMNERENGISGARKISLVGDVTGGLSVFFSVCTLLSYLSQKDAIENEKNPKSSKVDIIKWRIGGAAVSLVGAALESLGAILKKLATAKFAYSEASLIYRMSSRMLGVGEKFSILGAYSLGVLDLFDAESNMREGKIAIAALYAISGITTLMGATMFWAASVVSAGMVTVGAGALSAMLAVALFTGAIVMIVITVIASALIAIYTENGLQEWLAECAFGVRGSLLGTRMDLEKELKELKEVVDKMGMGSSKKKELHINPYGPYGSYGSMV